MCRSATGAKKWRRAVLESTVFENDNVARIQLLAEYWLSQDLTVL